MNINYFNVKLMIINIPLQLILTCFLWVELKYTRLEVFDLKTNIRIIITILLVLILVLLALYYNKNMTEEVLADYDIEEYEFADL